MDATQPDEKPGIITPLLRDVRVVALNRLSEDGYELVLERGGITFRAGQLINIHGPDHLEDRSYTVCGGERDEYLTVLFRLVPFGNLTPRLVRLAAGDTVRISGPYGEFTIRDRTRPLIFFATGTGVAPCRAYLRTFQDLDITLVHGARTAADLYYRTEFASITYHPCLTRENVTDLFHGRVTSFARGAVFPENSHYYLCGANEMIYEMQEILEQRGVDRGSIFTEAYYYRLDD